MGNARQNLARTDHTLEVRMDGKGSTDQERLASVRIRVDWPARDPYSTGATMDSATIKALGLILIVFLALAIKTGPGAAQAVGGPMEPIKVGVTLREYWVEAISREEALRRLAKRRLNPELRKRIEERIPRETKHYLTFHDKTFREYADFGEGFTSLLLTLPMEEKDSVFTVIVPIRGSERRDDGRIRQLFGIELDEFVVSGVTLIE